MCKSFFPILFFFSLFSSNAQVGIGTTNPNAAFDIESSSSGILIPRVALTSLNQSSPVVNPAGGNLVIGTLVFNTNSLQNLPSGFYYWDGTKWVSMKGGNSSDTDKNTLDKAYDQGGPGAGRTITADSGPVQINVTGSSSSGLRIDTNVDNTFAIYADQNSVGTTIRATNFFTGNNSFSTIQGRNNSSNNSSAAILGLSGGSGYAIIGQTDATSTSLAAVYGNNVRTSGGHGVRGLGYNGVVGENKLF